MCMHTHVTHTRAAREITWRNVTLAYMYTYYVIRFLLNIKGKNIVIIFILIYLYICEYAAYMLPFIFIFISLFSFRNRGFTETMQRGRGGNRRPACEGTELTITSAGEWNLFPVFAWIIMALIALQHFWYYYDYIISHFDWCQSVAIFYHK